MKRLLFVLLIAVEGGFADMPMLNWMGREKTVKQDKEVLLKILREDKKLGYCCQCGNAANPNVANGQLKLGIGTGNTSTMATLGKSTVLGVHGGTAYVLLYNGILKDRSVNGGNVLTRKTLEVIEADLSGRDYEKIVVYGEACRLMASTLEALKIESRQTPYDLVTRR